MIYPEVHSDAFAELKDHEIAILINALRDTALRYHDHQSLRERIARLVVPALKGEGLPKEARVKDSAENRPMPSDTVKDCIRTVFLKNGFTIKDGETDLKQYVYDAALELIASLGYRATPPAYWWINGQEDPHGEHYAVGVERSRLTLGELTDDELANGLFMNYDRKVSVEEILGGDIAPISWATAAKERIRWLSRQVTGLTDRVSQLQTENETLKQKLEATQIAYLRDTAALDRKIAELMRIGNSMVIVKAPHQVDDNDMVGLDDIRRTSEPATLVDPHNFGYCPTCGAPGVSRERRRDGYDVCQNGHAYPSSQSLQSPKEKT